MANGLVDSPAGRLAWIIEEFGEWTDSDGHPDNVLSCDELLEKVTMYWATGSPAYSARIYWESSAGYRASLAPVELPTGLAEFPKEVLRFHLGPHTAAAIDVEGVTGQVMSTLRRQEHNQ